jgi:CheY-like chemotaxis protein
VLITNIGRRKSDVDSFHASGVSAFIIKPVRQSQLASTLAGVLASPERGGDAAALEATAPLPHAEKQPRVLVVEDNVVNQKVALGQLRTLGIDGTVAASGAEALEELRKGGYDLVLLDCQMPDQDGYQVAREIRRREQGSGRIPIVAMTAYVLEGERERCLAAGMDDYLSKPVSTARLGEALGRWIKMPESPLDSEKVSGLKEIGKTNPKFMTDITTLFREDALVRLHDLRDSIAAANPEQLARAAHALKSSSGNIGAKRIYALCATLEENARAGRMAGAGALVDQMAAELDVAVAALARSAIEGIV